MARKNDPKPSADAPQQRGVVFPTVESSQGRPARRSTTATGRAIVVDALREVDPVGARAAEAETDWRRGYPLHFRRLLEAGLDAPERARSIAANGLASVEERMRWADDEGEHQLQDFARAGEGAAYATETVEGAGPAETTLSVPYRGRRLEGDELRRQLAVWERDGIVEPSFTAAIEDVIEHPEWLRMDGRTVVVLGAAAEMGPLRSLLRWGATVAGVDLPRPRLWEPVLADARRYAGRLLVPVSATAAGGGGAAAAGPGADAHAGAPTSAGTAKDRADLAQRAGADLLHDLGALTRWVGALEGPLTIGNYVYADGETNVRVGVAVDALGQELRRTRDDLSLAFLATPTDVFAVPGEAVAFSTERYERGVLARSLRAPLKVVSGGRLLTRNYRPGVEVGINDSVVPQQGPNYLLAKRIQRWRATEARAAGIPVSFSVAPPTRTRSVVKNRALAAAYAGAHRFGIEVFEPATANTLMAALLVRDLHQPAPAADALAARHPWQDEAEHAVHGGLWRAAYTPRSALGIAAVMGLAARN